MDKNQYSLKCNICKIDTNIEDVKAAISFIANHDHAGNIRHGNYLTYRDYLCRCDECRKANRDKQAEALDRARTIPVPENKHGTLTGYTYYGCRCVLCKERGSIYNREKRQREKERLDEK